MGNLRAYEEDRLGFLQRVAENYGPISAFDRRTTVLSDAGLARRVLGELAGTAVIRNNVLQEPIPVGEVASWPVARRLMNPVLRKRVIDQRRSQIVRLAVDHVRSSGARFFDAVEYWEPFTSRTAADYFLGEDGGRVPALVRDLLASLPAVAGNVFALPAAVPTPSRRRVRNAFAELRAHLLPPLTARARDPQSYDDAAGNLVRRAAQMEPRPGLDRLVNVLIGNLLASYTVPAAGLAWATWALSQHPEWITRVREEAPRALAPPDTANAQMPHTTGVLMESFRLYPPTWLLTRQLSSGAIVGGYALPAGQTIMTSPFVLHRDPANFDDPQSFAPERWGPGGNADPANFFGFGHGPRGCPGRDLAIISCSSALAALVSQADFEVTGDPTPNPRFILRPRALRIEVKVRRVG
ncbi:cytochrome P450 [Nocardioides KLBMP 9356]|uniref:Cytochrome P450 n=1 Tax=Nocardioides potassii TaxID=2911371 RepID=A0ABS9HA66_9ACTN|nr:cytochrome P450 [Nocardioides potassii]